MDEKRQVQKELFEEFADQPERRRQAKPIFHPRPKRTFTLSYEHIVITAIAFILVAVISFSLGVEKGKRSDNRQVKEPVSRKSSVGNEPKELAKEEIVVEVVSEEEPIQEPVEVKPVYTVQVASYSRKEDADKEAQKVEAKGYKSLVLLKGSYYIVCAGEFENKDKAKRLEKKLKSTYKDCYTRER